MVYNNHLNGEALFLGIFLRLLCICVLALLLHHHEV